MEWKLKPARDFGLPVAQRIGSQSRESGLIGTATHFLWRRLTRRYLRTVHRLAIEGIEHLPEPPFLFIANHSSHLDAMALLAALPARFADRAYALAAGDTFFTSFTASAFAAYGPNALPIWRKHTSLADLAALRARLEEDALVYVLFPEGTRSRTGMMGHFKPGLGAFVAGSAVPVVPAYLDGAFAAWPPQRHLPRPRPLHLLIGAPLRFSDTPNDRRGWASVAERCEEAVRRLGGLGQHSLSRTAGGG